MSRPEPTVVAIDSRTRSRRPGLALASRGDALTPFLFSAIERRYRVAGVIDSELSTLQRYLTAAMTFRPTRSRWVERFYKSILANRMRSANAAKRMTAFNSAPDAVVQVHALFSLPGVRSVVYIDCTHAQSARLWPAWNPLRGRALEEWYRRERETYDAAVHLFAFSEVTKASLVDDYDVDPSKITVTGAGINFDQMPQIPAVGSYRKQEPPTFLFIGNDWVRKGGPILLEAFRRVREAVPDARLQLVGPNLGIPSQPGVEVLGSIRDRRRIADLYRHASVFVVPSFFDPFPLVVLEAMAFGVPVVTTRQMGTPEMIVDGVTGRLVEPGSVEALAEAMLDIVRDPKAAHAMTVAARQDVQKRLTWDAVVDRMAPVLTALSPQGEK